MTDKTQDDQGDLDSNIFAFIFCRVLAFKISCSSLISILGRMPLRLTSSRALLFL